METTLFKEKTAYAGFPSPAEDFRVKNIDLNRQLINHPNATFLARSAGNHMRNAGIYDGDTMVIDRSLTAKSGDIVVAVVDDELVVKRLTLRNGYWELHSDSNLYRPIRLRHHDLDAIWGVVTYVIHRPM